MYTLTLMFAEYRINVAGFNVCNDFCYIKQKFELVAPASSMGGLESWFL